MSQLKPCPFCGQPPEEQHRKYNPFARCITPDCLGGKLPLISLDLPSDIERWNRRALPEAMALVPQEITAITWHKAGMIGDFKESVEVMCSDCNQDDPDPECGECGGEFFYQQDVPVSWTTIKAIHRRIVEIAESEGGSNA